MEPIPAAGPSKRPSLWLRIAWWSPWPPISIARRNCLRPAPRAAGQELIGVQPLIAAQLDLYTALRAQGMGTADLARRLGVSEKAAGQLLILNYSIPIDRVMAALAAVGVQSAAERAA